MTTTDSPPRTAPPGTAGGMDVLSQVREARLAADAAEAKVLIGAVEWAVQNPPLLGREAAAWYAPTSAWSSPPKHELTAEGVPDVDRAAVAELGLALGVSTQSAQALIGDALELAYRLPALWTRVVAGEVKPWRARRVAQATGRLSRLGAAFVDRQVAALADRVTGPQLDGLIETAMARHDQELAERLAGERAEMRRFEIRLDETSLAGLTEVRGRLELPDAQDLEAAVSHAATQQAFWGSSESLDVRRARALGDLARDYLSLTGEIDDGGRAATGERGKDLDGGQRTAHRRQVTLYVHLTDSTILDMIRCSHQELAGGVAAGGRCGVPMGRVENTGTPISAETIREWVGDPGAKVTVRPVLDLAEQLHAGAYEVPTRLKEQVRLRDGTCVFPGCFAQGLRCQADHVVPYDHAEPGRGGQTETSNLALLCQRHHNLKTHHGFRYTVLANGAVLWRTPHGLTVRRNRDDTVEYLTRPTSPGIGPAAATTGDLDPPEP